MYHQSMDVVHFTAQRETALFGRVWQPGEKISVGLVRDWDESEGQGLGGPWGWGGYSGELLAELSGAVGGRDGHDHLCRDCGVVVGHGDGDTCEVDADHDWSLCDQCAAKSHPIRPAQ